MLAPSIATRKGLRRSTLQPTTAATAAPVPAAITHPRPRW